MSSVITRELPPLATRAAFTPSSVDAERRTVELVWSTGAKVLRGAFERFYEELSLDPKHVRLERLNNGAPLLDGHPIGIEGYSRAAIVRGVVVEGSARTDGQRGYAKVRFARAEDDPEADALFRKIKDEIVQNVSIGYRVFSFQRVGDKDEKIPTLRAVDWEPFEISTVSVGADDGAGFRSGFAMTNSCRLLEDEPQELVNGFTDEDRNQLLRLNRAIGAAYDDMDDRRQRRQTVDGLQAHIDRIRAHARMRVRQA